jgi:hypothetical protein
MAWGGADIGSLPAVAAGVGASLSLLYQGQRFELGLALWPERAGRTTESPSSGADVGLVTGALGTCRDLVTYGPMVVRPCVAFELGRMNVTAFGVNEPKEVRALWAALRPGAIVALNTGGQASFVGRAEAAIPLSRPEFTVEGAGIAHRAGPVAGRVTAGLEFRF